MRVKRGVASHRRHKSVLRKAKGFKYGRARIFKKAKQAVLKAGQHSYEGRKLKKRTFRRLWIIRLNAALREHGMMYSRFIDAITKKNIKLDRKILSNLAVEEPAVFKKIVELAKS